MTDYTSKSFLGQFGLSCDNCQQVDRAEIESRGALVLLKLEGFRHLYVDEPFDAYYLCVNHGDMNFGIEWFGIDELAEAEKAFKFRLANNPTKAYRGTIAHDIGTAVQKLAHSAAAQPMR